MSNILGKPFEPWVTKQIEIRQRALGKYSNIEPKYLQYYTTKTPWARLASSVNLDFRFESGGVLKDSIPKKLIEAGIDVSNFDGNELAKNAILQSGVISTNNQITFNSGINSSNSLFNGAYGWGGIEERGYVPMPGITNVDVQYLNNGALTKTTINIKCFNKKQFQIIDVLYLRPGYTLLLEFGHSVYLDNDENLQSFENFYTEPLRILLNPGDKNQYDIFKEINNERKKHFGNYDAVYGKISNFNWQFNPDGSYDCQVILTGMGDVIESLKMNVTTDAGDDLEENNSSGNNTSLNPIIANKTKSQLNEILYRLYQKISSKNKITFFNTTIKNFSDPDDNFNVKDLEIKNALLSIPIKSADNKENQSPQTYITFGALMAFIQKQFLLYNTLENKKIPIVSFDINFNNLKNDENYILTFPGGFSSDPTICLIPYTNTAPPVPNLNIPNSDINIELSKYSSWVTDSIYLGRLTGIYINIGYISNVLASFPFDEENKINLLDFLKEIIKGITQALGGFNKISIKSTIDGKIQFIEDIPQNFSTNKNNEEYARFNVFGVKPGVEGSFIKNINLTADLGSNFATMISIGAQNNGNQLSGNAISFSNYNYGLEDRIIPEKSSYIPVKVDKVKEEKENIESNYKKIKDLLLNIYQNKNFIDKNISTLKSLNTTHADLIIGKLSQPEKDQQIQAPFFLPFNFSIEMEGLSGMTLYQKFLISEEILPPSYEKDGVEIQIKGINHSINTTTWTTKLDTLSVPSFKPSDTPQYTSYPLGNASSQASAAAMTTTTGLGALSGQTLPLSLVTPPPSLDPTSLDRFNAMQKSYNGVFSRDGSVAGMCAKWTYNLATNYINFLRGGELKTSQLSAGGNANNNNQYYINLTNLGYTKTKSVVTKEQLINQINTTVWGYGDVIAYWCNNGPTDQSHVKYGHTQIYIGEINSSKWATSVQNNYGTNFPYSNRTGDNWTYLVFRAPSS
jgi:hypothetical protein